MSNARLSLYDGRDAVAVIEQRKDGWHVIVRDRHIGVVTNRAAAFNLVHATINPPASQGD